MDDSHDIQGDFLGPPYDRTPAAVIAAENQNRSFKSSEHIEKGNGPSHSFGY